MLNNSQIGRLAQDILRWMEPETQRLIEKASPEQRKTYQTYSASYLARTTEEPYTDIYRAMGMVIAEIAERPEGPTQ